MEHKSKLKTRLRCFFCESLLAEQARSPFVRRFMKIWDQCDSFPSSSRLKSVFLVLDANKLTGVRWEMAQNVSQIERLVPLQTCFAVIPPSMASRSGSTENFRNVNKQTDRANKSWHNLAANWIQRTVSRTLSVSLSRRLGSKSFMSNDASPRSAIACSMNCSKVTHRNGSRLIHVPFMTQHQTLSREYKRFFFIFSSFLVLWDLKSRARSNDVETILALNDWLRNIKVWAWGISIEQSEKIFYSGLDQQHKSIALGLFFEFLSLCQTSN